MHAVVGSLMVRDGKYLTDFDATFRLQGVYVEDLGRFTAVAEPLTPVKLRPVVRNDTTTTTTTAANSESMRKTRAKDVVAHSAALREAAAGLAGLTDAELEALERWMVDSKRNPTHSNGMDDDETIDSPPCKFSLDVLFLLEPGGGGGGGSLGQQRTLSPSSLSNKLIRASGQLHSPACGLTLHVTALPADTKKYEEKAIQYSIMMATVAFVQVALTMQQTDASSSAAAASRVSLFSLGQQAIMDAFLCLLHLTLAIMVEPLFNAFASAAFIEFCLFGIFELRMLLSTWRARRRGAIDAWVLQRELSTVYARFYGALLISLLLCYNLRHHMQIVTFVVHAFWVPQIIRSSISDSKPPFLSSYVIGMSMTRLVLPLYIFGCPGNLLKVEPSLGMCMALIGMVGGQAVLVLGQMQWGPRFFVPKQFLPPKFDYYAKVVQQRKGDIETGDVEDCVICMNPIDPGEDGGGGKSGRKKTMVAPCHHRFHEHCLQRWMMVKMECPTCRRVLPPP